jgi:hypothetical protein
MSLALMTVIKNLGRHNNNLPACRLHPGTNKDLAAIRCCILPSWNQPGHGSHRSKETSPTHFHHITDIDKQDRIKFQVTHQGLFGWSHEKTVGTRQHLTTTKQAKQVFQATTPDQRRLNATSFKFLATMNTWCTIIKVVLSVDGLLKNVLAQHLPEPL